MQQISKKVHITVCISTHNKYLGLRGAALTSVYPRIDSRIYLWSENAFRQCNINEKNHPVLLLQYK